MHWFSLARECFNTLRVIFWKKLELYVLPHTELDVCSDAQLFLSVEEANFAEFYARYLVTIGMLNNLFWPLILYFEAWDLLYAPRDLTLKSNKFCATRLIYLS